MGVSPLAQRGLDAALGLAVGLWGAGASEALFEAESGDGGAPGVGAVAGAVVGGEAFGVEAELGQEGECGVEEGEGALGGLLAPSGAPLRAACGRLSRSARFIREELGKGEAGRVIAGDVEELPARPWSVIALTVAGHAMAGAHDAREFLEARSG